MYSKFRGKCAECGAPFDAGSRIEWDKTTRQTLGPCCADLDDAREKPLCKIVEPPVVVEPAFDPDSHEDESFYEEEEMPF